jgi:hypothetical protein
VLSQWRLFILQTVLWGLFAFDAWAAQCSQERSSIIAGQQTSTFSNADVQSLAQKLTQFNQTLTPGEQEAMALVVLGAMPQEPEEADTQGFWHRRHEDWYPYRDRPDVDWEPFWNIFGPHYRHRRRGESW